MGNGQKASCKKDGFTKIANSVAETYMVAHGIPAKARVWMFVARYSFGDYGWEMRTSAKEIAECCEISVSSAKRCISELEADKIIWVGNRKKGQRSFAIGINPYLEQWVLVNGTTPTRNKKSSPDLAHRKFRAPKNRLKWTRSEPLLPKSSSDVSHLSQKSSSHLGAVKIITAEKPPGIK